MKIFLLLILFIPNLIYGQSLSKERVKKIKACTVQIMANGSTGTGFFIASNGVLLTCWHVIEPAIKRDNSGKIIGIEDIYAAYPDGTYEKFGLSSKGNNNGTIYDFCILIPTVKPTKNDYPFLKLGNYENADEGAEIYTCGYPIGITQQFISKGIISTKFVDTISFNNGTKEIKIPRSQALLDLTMNRGNSGGAIVKIGASIDDDEVIGIADFIISPAGQSMQNLERKLNQVSNSGVGASFNGVSIIDVDEYFAETISKFSIGVSGLISINHFLLSNGVGNR